MDRRKPTSLTGNVLLREVQESDLLLFFEHQREPDANRMAAFPPRDRDAFMAHWAKILRDENVVTRTILFDGAVAGNVVSWENAGHREIGYWIGREYWGKGIASRAHAEFLNQLTARPLFAHVAKRNVPSIRVLEKCGFIVCGEDKSPAPTGGEAVEEFIMQLNGKSGGKTR